MKQQIKLVAQLFKVERKEMGGGEDFLSVKLLNKVNLNIFDPIMNKYIQATREGVRTPAKAVKGPAVSNKEEVIRKQEQEGVSKYGGSRGRRGKVWNREKTGLAQRKVYGRGAAEEAMVRLAYHLHLCLAPSSSRMILCLRAPCPAGAQCWRESYWMVTRRRGGGAGRDTYPGWRQRGTW